MKAHEKNNTWNSAFFPIFLLFVIFGLVSCKKAKLNNELEDFGQSAALPSPNPSDLTVLSGSIQSGAAIQTGGGILIQSTLGEVGRGPALVGGNIQVISGAASATTQSQ